jgi:hypothetical protein
MGWVLPRSVVSLSKSTASVTRGATEAVWPLATSDKANTMTAENERYFAGNRDEFMDPPKFKSTTPLQKLVLVSEGNSSNLSPGAGTGG